MLVIRMEIWPQGNEQKKETVATATIINDGSGDDRTGNYDVTLYNGKRRWKTSRVESFPRKKLIGWDILARALHDMLAKRNGMASAK